MEDRSRPFIGFESHTIFVDGGSPFTFITSGYQPQNEGRVMILKINSKILFNDIKIQKDYINRIDEKQQSFVNSITLQKRTVEKGF